MHIILRKIEENKLKVIYNLEVEKFNSTCTFYKQSGAIILEPNILIRHFSDCPSREIRYLARLFLFFARFQKNNFYPDSEGYQSCS